jgi:hypothetical protein
MPIPLHQSIAVLLPTPNYTFAIRQLMISVASYLAIATALSILIFPESMNKSTLSVLEGQLGRLKIILEGHHELFTVVEEEERDIEMAEKGDKEGKERVVVEEGRFEKLYNRLAGLRNLVVGVQRQSGSSYLTCPFFLFLLVFFDVVLIFLFL